MIEWEPGTADDLIADARARGQVMTSRGITDWVQKGLLDRPTRHGAGRGKGSTKGVFSAQQREVFNAILVQRAKHPTGRIGHLTVIPVWMWLYWGDDWVPYRQVVRALKEWVVHYRTASRPKALVGIDGLLDQLSHPDATDEARRRLRGRLLDDATRGRITDTDQLLPMIYAVWDPHRQGRRLGPPGLQVSIESVINSWQLNARARTALHHGTVTRAQLEYARAQSRVDLNEYLLARPHLLAMAGDHPEAASLTEPTMEGLVQHACNDLLLPLGVAITRGHP